MRKQISMKQRPIGTAGLLLIWAALIYACNGSGTDHPVSAETGKTENDYRAIGKNAATQAQSVLAKNLVTAIQKAGTEYAIEFCNTTAIHLTDSMAHSLNAGIRRVTDKPRNAGNQANENERAYIQVLKDKLNKGDSLVAKMTAMNGKMVGYYPIVTNAMCLQCHGNKDTDIRSATYEKIKKLYPADKATGYRENEVRGLWVVEMEKDKNQPR